MHKWLQSIPKSYRGIGKRLMQIAAILVLLLSVKRDLSLNFHSDRHPTPYDFRAIYCGEYVTVHEGNPYLARPLRDCEVASTKNQHFNLNEEKIKVFPLPNEALPATFPPFALNAFAPLGYLSELNAQRLLYVLGFIAFLATIWIIATLVELPLALVTIVFTCGMYTQSSVVGAIAPLSTLGMALTAYFYTKQKYIATSVSFLLTMLEPQTGIALFAALFLKERFMRIPLIGAALFLFALCLPFHGMERLLEYPQMLAIHSRAEEYEIYQLSLTYIVHLLGTPERLSATLGTMAYAIYVATSLIYIRKQPQNSALVVAIPAAFSVLPGSFVHSVYLANMFLAALLFFKKYDSMFALAGVALIATSWQPILRPAYDIYLFSSVLAFAAIAMYTRFRGRERWIAPLWVFFTLLYCKLFVRTPEQTAVPPSLIPAHYASEEWYHFLSMQHEPIAEVWFLKIPLFLGMACILLAMRPRIVNKSHHETLAI